MHLVLLMLAMLSPPAHAEPPPWTPLGDVTVVPGLEVHVRATTRNSPQGNYTTFVWVSEGLAAYGQKEMIFSLGTQEEGIRKDHLRAANSLFVGALEQAKNGQVVDVGDLTIVQGPIVPGTNFTGVVYTEGYPVGGTNASAESHLHLVLLHDLEVKALPKRGVMRILGGVITRYGAFPAPRFNDFQRPPSDTLIRGESLLTTVPQKLRVQRSYQEMRVNEAQDVNLWIHPRDRRSLKSTDPSRSAAILFPIQGPIRGWLVWDGVSESPQAVSAGPVDSYDMNMLVVAIGEKDGATMTEDGVALTLSPTSASEFWKAARKGRTWSIPMEDATFTLRSSTSRN